MKSVLGYRLVLTVKNSKIFSSIKYLLTVKKIFLLTVPGLSISLYISFYIEKISFKVFGFKLLTKLNNLIANICSFL